MLLMLLLLFTVKTGVDYIANSNQGQREKSVKHWMRKLANIL